MYVESCITVLSESIYFTLSKTVITLWKLKQDLKIIFSQWNVTVDKKTRSENNIFSVKGDSR